jgi:hypothetical protein
MTRKLIHPALIGKMIQKVEEDEQGNVFLHTKGFVLTIGWAFGKNVHELTPREGKPEPLVIPANK